MTEFSAATIRQWYRDYGWGYCSDIVRLWALMQNSPFTLQQLRSATGVTGYVINRLIVRKELVATPERTWTIGHDIFLASTELARWIDNLGLRARVQVLEAQREAACTVRRAELAAQYALKSKP